MRGATVCSGIGAPEQAMPEVEWVFGSEIDPAPSAVHAYRFPGVPNWGDMTKFQDWPDADIDLLIGGTPCQSFSVAGLRRGLADPRGNLALTFLAIAAKYNPRWILWENVPGVLSSDGGRDFGSFLGGLGQCGYGWAYRVLDAQHFGIPQRRRRVFVVGYLGDWRRAAAVLFERHSLQGHPAPRREKGERVADSLTVGANQCSGFPGDFTEASTGQISHCLNAGGMGRQDYETETLIAHCLRAEGFDAGEDGTGRGTPLVPVHYFDARQSDVLQYGDKTGPLDTDGQTHAICFTAKDHGAGASDIAPTLRAGGHSGSHANAGVMAFTASEQANSFAWEREVYPTLPAQVPNDSSNIQQGVRIGSAVRRLTPRECERLQGFPDDFTLVPYRGGMMKDGPRYKMLGNSMAVPVLVWLGQRIQMVEDICSTAQAAT